jgi:hypothetical protein
MSRAFCLDAVIAFLMLVVMSPAIGTADDAPPTTSKLVLIVGSPGSEEYGQMFALWAEQWREVAKQANAELVEIGVTTDGETSDLELIRSTIAKSVAEKDARPLWLVFVGHGTFQLNVAKFNLRGPDVTPNQMAQWLKPVEAPIVIVNTASASGPFVNALSGPGRVIVTATKSGQEQNFARFGAYLPKALTDTSADLDHDDEVSLLEAVIKASAETQQFYTSDARILTENAMIDDNGDQLGTPATTLKSKLLGAPAAAAEAAAGKATSVPDGDAAAKTILIPSSASPVLLPEELEERDRLEGEILMLRRKKSTLSEEDYYQQIEQKMLALAAIYEAAENRAQSPPSSP